MKKMLLSIFLAILVIGSSLHGIDSLIINNAKDLKTPIHALDFSKDLAPSISSFELSKDLEPPVLSSEFD